MFEKTEIAELNEEINIVGLSLQKSGLPITFKSLGKMWGIYGDTCRGKDKISGIKNRIRHSFEHYTGLYNME